MNRHILLIVLALLPFLSSAATGSPIKDDETVIFFPTNAYLDSDGKTWTIPIHGWIFELEEDSLWRSAALETLPGLLGIEPDESNQALYEQRGRLFLVDNERDKEIEIQIGDQRRPLEASEPNGHFHGTVRIEAAHAAAMSETGWLTFHAVMPKGDGRVFEGKVQLIAPTGVSIISDIDDTIKISNVKDKQALLANTFLRPFRAVPGMAEIYRKWAGQGAVVHYLSASPWQLYPALAEFIVQSGFPAGSFHLKNIRLKDETFFNLFSSQEEYKKPLVEQLLKTYPGRRFILIGDGGEEDPEIFASVARSYPNQVLRVLIRDEAPKTSESERYQKLFQEMPKSRWSIFRDGSELSAIDIVEQSEKKSQPEGDVDR